MKLRKCRRRFFSKLLYEIKKRIFIFKIFKNHPPILVIIFGLNVYPFHISFNEMSSTFTWIHRVSNNRNYFNDLKLTSQRNLNILRKGGELFYKPNNYQRRAKLKSYRINVLI